MDRRQFLASSLVAAGVAGVNPLQAAEAAVSAPASAPASRPAPSNAPNVLLIVSDQHNVKVQGHMGHPSVLTPNLDRMAAEGVRFEACTTANPICTPSRVSILSGQYCHNHGYYGLSGPNPRGLPSILGHFRRNGYRTAAFGKIHCPEGWVEADCDEFCDPAGCSEGKTHLEYQKYLKDKGLPEIEDHLALTEFGPQGRQALDARPSNFAYEDSFEGWLVRRTISFIEGSRKLGQPFIAEVSLPRPHQCYTPSKQFWDLYDPAKLVLPPNASYDMANKAPYLREGARMWAGGEWALFEPKTFEAARMRKLRGYLGCVSMVDHAVGELLDWLKANGLDENTIVIYTADHGDYACEHGIMEKSPGVCADAITRVPFLWRWPGRLHAGHVARDVVETVDIASTVCGLAGIDPLQTADGRDLSPILRGEPGDPSRPGVTENPWSRSLRRGPWRLVNYPRLMFAEEYPEGFGELYNLVDDPWEMKNLYFEPEHHQTRLDLERELLEWLITTTRPATFHGSALTATGNEQLSLHYEHAVNADNKMHWNRLPATLDSGYKNYL